MPAGKTTRARQFHRLALFAAVWLAGFAAGCRREGSANGGISPEHWSPDTPVWDALIALGEPAPDHWMTAPEPALIDYGRRLVYGGNEPAPGGSQGPAISAHFRCADCHLSVRDTGDLRSLSDAGARLRYAVERNLPLPPGTSFAGIVNRDRWFDGDAREALGLSESSDSAQTNLRTAISFCARSMAKGRPLESQETEALLAYFWSLQWKLGDLGLTGLELAEWKRLGINPAGREALIRELKARYAATAPFTLGSLPEDHSIGYPVPLGERNLETGRAIFQRSCLHCHDADGASGVYFGGDKLRIWRSLTSRFRGDLEPSLYEILRQGTKPEAGRPAAMPPYAKERLSDSQIESLRIWLDRKLVEKIGGPPPP